MPHIKKKVRFKDEKTESKYKSEILNYNMLKAKSQTDLKNQMRNKKELKNSSPNTKIIWSADDMSLKTIMNTLSIMFPEQSHLVKKESSCTQARNVFTARDAEKWGDNFTIPTNVVDSDEALFQASMRDIDVMVNRKKPEYTVRVSTLTGLLYISRARILRKIRFYNWQQVECHCYSNLDL